ncbi:MAG: fluoride efflux transporter CrcB [Lewinellaceae bacterium]|nr:fluoride efflux transporter CrcB [Lewinella sp.]MCB9277757.1 fluoride efflux transporter CrcB [Lewinellaceae bacterium]
MMKLILVFAGGGLGSVCRYGVAVLVSKYPALAWSFPVATFLANAVSCIILGSLFGLSSRSMLNESQRLLLMTGFCGGFSTFSTFTGESLGLLQDGQLLTWSVYLFLSIVICLGCFWLGLRLTIQ